MKENHSEIAEKILSDYQWADKSFKREAITAALDQAHAAGDKAGYDRGVRESAEMVHGKWHFGRDATCSAILSLLAPPAPVWQHKQDCPTPYRWTKHAYDQEWWCCPDIAGKPLLKQSANYCDGCGAPRPETKGS